MVLANSKHLQYPARTEHFHTHALEVLERGGQDLVPPLLTLLIANAQ
jgi:hypothetical protein